MDELTEEAKLEAMKARADGLGVEYGHNIGLDTLTKRVEAAEAEQESSGDAETEADEGLPAKDVPRELTGAEALAISGDY